jgi:predicted branched-subunit amino acid permease
MTGSAYRSPRAAALGGMRASLGMPAVILGASYLGFGSLCREAGFSLWLGFASTATGWALPGQIALVELYAVGASLLAIGFAVALTNARLLPMTVALMPLLRHPGTPRWRYYFFAHFIAITGWTIAMQRCPDLPTDQRLPYFAGFAMTLWSVTLTATGFGFVLASLVPDYITLGLVFLNPIYFMLVFAADFRHRIRALALGLGAVTGPFLHLVDPDWGLLATGLLAGSAAFLVDRALDARTGRPHA